MKRKGVFLTLRDGQDERGKLFINQLPEDAFRVTWINTEYHHNHLGFASEAGVENFTIDLAEIFKLSVIGEDYEQYLTEQIEEHKGKATKLRKQVKELGAKPIA